MPPAPNLPLAVQKLPAEHRLPLGTRLLLGDVLGVSGMGAGAIGHYRNGDPTSTNWSWATRKVGLVKVMFKSSYRIVLERGADKPRLLEPQWGMDATQYAIAGGAFPIRVNGVGIIGAVAVSGLHERDDHEFARSAIAQSLGLEASAYALPTAA